MNRKTQTHILLADDHTLFRGGFKNLFRNHPTYHISEASNGKQAVDLALQHEFDIIFMDERMPELQGFDAAKLILQAKPESKIIAFTQFDEITLIMNYFHLGLKGYMAKNIEPEQLFEAISAVMAGHRYFHTRFDDGIKQWLAAGMKATIPSIRFGPRDLDLIIHISKGKTTKEIAEILGITYRTVETYRKDLIEKVGCGNSAALVAYVYKNGILGS